MKVSPLVALFFVSFLIFPSGASANYVSEGDTSSVFARFLGTFTEMVEKLGFSLERHGAEGMLAGVSYTGPLCPVSTIEGIPGIGDGCTFEYKNFDLSYIPEIGVFKGTFTGACNNHDKCFTTLGRTGDECNALFLSEMKAACDDKYSKLLQPVERNACRQSAELYKAGVDQFLRDANPMPEMQAAAYAESLRLKEAYDAGKCVTSPSRTTLYSPSLIGQVENAFMNTTGRSPSMAEFLGALHMYSHLEFPGYFLSHREWWDEHLSEYASLRRWYKPPQVSWSREMDTLLVTNPDSSFRYEWNIGGIPKSIETSVYIGTANPPKYDTFKPIKGYVRATSPRGFTNISIIDMSLLVRGWCSAKPGNPCLHSSE